MRIKIYQINSSRDMNRVKYWGLESLSEFQNSSEMDASLYDNVFDAEMDEMGLEEIWTRFNHEKHPLYRGHSLSVSDVVVTDKGAFFCDSFGFKEIEFDESKTQKQNNLMQVLYVEPHRKPFVTEIVNTLEGVQKAVGGGIEYLDNGDGTVIGICEDSKNNGSEGNRRFRADVLAGPFFIAEDDGEDIKSISENTIEKYTEIFLEPEDISAEEVQAHNVIKCVPWPMSLQ